MGPFFLWINKATIYILAITFLLGVISRPGFDFTGAHSLTGLSASVLGLFGLVAIMFFLLATGGYMKELLKGGSDEKEFSRRIASLKMSVYPWCTLEIALLIAVTVAGGGLLSGAPVYWHHLALSILTLAAYIKTYKISKISFLENRELLKSVLEKKKDIPKP
ncbi:MAG: hypothetical protein OEY64_01925 [Nitrospinota bacterium]|nr:hypothetical protein [Nitrospinota bacterium]